MKIFRGFLSSSLRFKILFGLLLSIGPMLAIVGISYYSARNAALQNSDRMMQLMTRNGAREINGWLTAQEGAFLDWTKEDVFGMAIEFQTTKELLNQFQLWLKGQEAFSLLLLADKDGKVMEAAIGEHTKGVNPEAFQGRTVKEAAGFLQETARSAELVQSEFVKQLGQSSGYTYLFVFKAKDTANRTNGFFLAYMNWDYLQAKVNAVSNEMKTNGFKNANVAIVDTASGVALAHSNAKMIDARLDKAASMKSWLKTARSGEVRVFDFGRETDYVTFFPVQSASGFFEKDNATAKASGLVLTTFAPENDIMADVQKILWTSAGIGGGGGILIVLIGIFIVGLISKPLNRAIEGLTEGADQVAAASGQVASSSHLLAEGASEQASSLEETSSSLEEMASMTKQNADNANKANGLMKQANEVVERANTSMAELTTSMEEIAKASEETSKIIKTIDEIAFQTNLLALNAAVEAARAGEAGAGFAVVADEVRNLAMRAADAANNTANLIEETVKKVKDGSELVTRTNKAFTEVAASAGEVGDLVAEIAAASQDQARGIEQVNIAVAEMDKTTNQTASSAEESASAAEEMNAQAQQMKGMVAVLADVVGSSGKSAGKKKAVKPKNVRVQKIKALPISQNKLKRKALTVRAPRELSANDIIPMEDEDFEKF